MAILSAFLTTLSRAEDSFFHSNGVKIRYVTAGEGVPVVLIHGWMGDAAMWGKDSSGNAKPTPPAGFRVIAMDCRGHGKSDKPHDASKYGAEMALDVVRLLDHLRIKKAHLVGYSMGAFIVGKVVATHPERVLSAIYGGQAPLLIGEAGAKEIEVFAKAVDEGKGLGPYIMEVRPGLTPEAANAIAKMMYDGKDVKAWALAGLSFGGFEVNAEDLAKARIPTLFVYGSKESEGTKTRIAALQKLLVMCELKVIEGGDHISTLAKPDFGATIVKFLGSAKQSGL